MGTRQSGGFISRLQADRSSLTEVLVLAVALALAVSLAANVLFSVLTLFAVIGGTLLLIAACMVYLWVRRFGTRTKDLRFTGFLLYDKSSKRLIPVKEYELSERACSYLNAAFAENAALMGQWEEDPLENTIQFDPKTHAAHFKDTLSRKLLLELLEYVTLETLSTHLIDHFNSSEVDKAKLRVYLRSDIPDILLRNRFLELFSKPQQDRPLFKETKTPQNSGEVVMAWAQGAHYSRFDLMLPEGSQVKRGDSGGFEIDGPILNLSITPGFQGANTYVPAHFRQYYVGVDKPLGAVTAYSVEIRVKVTVKLRGLFTKTPWTYHQWTESFLEKLREVVDSQAFFESIQWPVIDAVLFCLKHLDKKHRHTPDPLREGGESMDPAKPRSDIGH